MGLRSVTSLPGSADGVMRSGLRVGPMIGRAGRGVVRANLTARQAKEKGLLTSGTFGQRSTISSRSVDLAFSLGSRLRQRLATAGSTLFKQTWKERVTPSGRTVWLPVVSGHRTRGNGCTSWPTTRETDGEKNVPSVEGSLKEIERKGSPQDLCQAAQTAGWATPSVRDHKDTGDLDKSLTRKDGKTRNDTVPRQAWMTTWISPQAKDWRSGQGERYLHGSHAVSLNDQATITIGERVTGSLVKTEGRGQLNPAFSLWLQGFPTEWALCAARVTRSSLNAAKRLSKRT